MTLVRRAFSLSPVMYSFRPHLFHPLLRLMGLFAKFMVGDRNPTLPVASVVIQVESNIPVIDAEIFYSRPDPKIRTTTKKCAVGFVSLLGLSGRLHTHDFTCTKWEAKSIYEGGGD